MGVRYVYKVANLPPIHFRKQSATDGTIRRIWRLDSGPNLQPWFRVCLNPSVGTLRYTLGTFDELWVQFLGGKQFPNPYQICRHQEKHHPKGKNPREVEGRASSEPIGSDHHESRVIFSWALLEKMIFCQRFSQMS